MEACEKASENPLHKKIVDQIIAVDNFIAFKKLMMKRNQELNEQALSIIMNKEKSQTTAGKETGPSQESESQDTKTGVIKTTPKTTANPKQIEELKKKQTQLIEQNQKVRDFIDILTLDFCRSCLD